MARNTTKMTCRYIVTGRVQGVGFRHWTVMQAREKALRGWVCNLSDGRVEVVAYGEKDVLDSFELLLASGPSAADVAGVELAPITPEDAELAARATGFEQTRSR